MSCNLLPSDCHIRQATIPRLTDFAWELLCETLESISTFGNFRDLKFCNLPFEFCIYVQTEFRIAAFACRVPAREQPSGLPTLGNALIPHFDTGSKGFPPVAFSSREADWMSFDE
jgi:hypothetical protein